MLPGAINEVMELDLRRKGGLLFGFMHKIAAHKCKLQLQHEMMMKIS